MDFLSINTNNAGKFSNTKYISNTGKTGNIKGSVEENTIDSILRKNKGPKKAKKYANMVPVALTHLPIATINILALAFFSFLINLLAFSLPPFMATGL